MDFRLAHTFLPGVVGMKITFEDVTHEEAKELIDHLQFIREPPIQLGSIDYEAMERDYEDKQRVYKARKQPQ